MRHPAVSLCSIALVSLLASCVSTEDEAAKTLEDTGLVSPNSSYKNVTQYPGNVTCGKYLTTDYSGFPIYQDFVVLNTVANLRPLILDVKIYCTKDPAGALDVELGINYQQQKQRIDRILQDFRELAVPLEAYISDNTSYPWTEQGLQALVQPSTSGNPPRNFPENGYIRSIPTDPWNRNYYYVCEPFAGIKIPYHLQTLGADGVKGGTGENADIKHDYLPYFDHINNL